MLVRSSTLVFGTLVGVGLAFSTVSANGAESQHSSAAARSVVIRLTCSESAGQQHRGAERVVGGVEGLELKSSGEFSSLTPIRGPGGKHYYVYKAFLAVSPTVSRYATVTVVSPKTATLFYGRSSEVGKLASRADGEALVAASRRRVRLPVCGRAFTGFVGGFVVAGPSRVTVVVASPHKLSQRVTIDVGTK